MSEYADYSDLPGYVSIKEAAKILGISEKTVYYYVDKKRLLAHRAADVLMIPLEEVNKFQMNPSGRPRKNTPLWRSSAGENTQFMTLIFVKIRTGCRDELLKKLEGMRLGKRHLFPGTVVRSMMESETEEGLVTIVLVWRGVIMPPEREREEALAALREELADVLDWGTARYTNGHVLMHT